MKDSSIKQLREVLSVLSRKSGVKVDEAVAVADDSITLFFAGAELRLGGMECLDSLANEYRQSSDEPH